ncbi:MAG TPA: cobalt-precorrin-7 (C(5))-methyltransferase [Methanoregulaceae archaeon]|nr:cobalt-precorrin-7 (C(5))-methyltransferase [Methanoregulaceae archaeon]HQJ86929.1 cobalt-precorrin-7 (C(5))-methyltransferase [Methanoregulaceae archaeon]
MKIVGVGCGPGMMTGEAIRAIGEAAEVHGSARAIELASEAIRPGCPVHEITDYRALRTLDDGAVVLSTGDPMLSGLGYLPGEIVPGISSLQVALARLHLPWTRVVVVSAHGRDHAAACAEAGAEVARGRIVFLLADPTFAVDRLAGVLGADSPGARIAVCESLGYPDERIRVGTVGDPPIPSSPLFVVVAGIF